MVLTTDYCIGEKMKNIAFWDHGLKETGTTTALFDYAYFNQELLGNKSFVFFERRNPRSNSAVIKNFEKAFPTIGLDHFDEVDRYIADYNISHIYIAKSGEDTQRQSKIAKNCIHCVFDVSNPHGHVYASLSSHVRGYNSSIPVVPYMINLPDNSHNMRERLAIPENATVFGGYGGKRSFNIEYVKDTVIELAGSHRDMYFLFANFVPFCSEQHNVCFLPTITDLEEKVNFINTCDAMLWARRLGETFGLAIGEFSSKNKPIIACKVGYTAHVEYLGDNALWYDANSLRNILTEFRPSEERNKDWNNYRDFTPEKVMAIFNEVFLE